MRTSVQVPKRDSSTYSSRAVTPCHMGMVLGPAPRWIRPSRPPVWPLGADCGPLWALCTGMGPPRLSLGEECQGLELASEDRAALLICRSRSGLTSPHPTPTAPPGRWEGKELWGEGLRAGLALLPIGDWGSGRRGPCRRLCPWIPGWEKPVHCPMPVSLSSPL